MKCFTRAALCILNGDASLRILSTDASGCFFINVTFTAVAETSTRGDFFSKAIINSVFHSSNFILNWRAYTSPLHIHIKYEYRIPFMIWDDIFKSIFNESVWISITISLKFIPKGPIDYKSALVQVVAWHRTGEKPLSESMLTQFTDAYIRH